MWCMERVKLTLLWATAAVFELRDIELTRKKDWRSNAVKMSWGYIFLNRLIWHLRVVCKYPGHDAFIIFVSFENQLRITETAEQSVL